MDEFDMINLEKMKYFLDIEVMQISNRIFTRQKKYMYRKCWRGLE